MDVYCLMKTPHKEVPIEYAIKTHGVSATQAVDSRWDQQKVAIDA